MPNVLLQMMMGQLQTRNPKMFQMIAQAKNSGVNPQDFMKQMIGDVSPEQLQNVFRQAKSMGVPPEILNQIQNLR